MHTIGAGRLVKRQLQQAVVACSHAPNKELLRIRRSAACYRVARSTLSDAISRAKSNSLLHKAHGRQRAFSQREDKIILDIFLKYFDHGMPRNRPFMREALALFIDMLSAERSASLPFNREVPGGTATFYWGRTSQYTPERIRCYMHFYERILYLRQ